MHHHISTLAIFLATAAVCFIACCIGILTDYANLAIAFGMILVFVVTGGLFFATLHLQKVH